MAPSPRARRRDQRDSIYTGPRKSPTTKGLARHPLGLPVWQGMLVWPLTERERRAQARREERRREAAKGRK